MDKVQKIREEVARIQLYTQSEVLKQVLDYIDEVQKEPVSEKKCMFTKDNYTDEDRMILCENCKEKCEYSKKEEPASEELGEYINKLSKRFPEVSFAKLSRIAVRVAKWQKEQLMKDAIECKVDWYDGFLLDYTQEQQDGLLEKIGADVGDKVRVIVIKED